MSQNTNGYVVYPSGAGRMDLAEAKKVAAEESEESGFARVESCDDEHTVANFRNGVEVE